MTHRTYNHSELLRLFLPFAQIGMTVGKAGPPYRYMIYGSAYRTGQEDAIASIQQGYFSPVPTVQQTYNNGWSREREDLASVVNAYRHEDRFGGRRSYD